jgi:hypothetical protein
LDAAQKEPNHLNHLVKYYQDSTHATIFLKSEFQDAYAKFTSEIHLFNACVVNYQEDTLMELETYKDVDRWYENEYQYIEQIDYINAV